MINSGRGQIVWINAQKLADKDQAKLPPRSGSNDGGQVDLIVKYLNNNGSF